LANATKVRNHIPFRMNTIRIPGVWLSNGYNPVFSERLREFHEKVFSSSYPMSGDEVRTLNYAFNIRTVINLNISTWDEDVVWTVLPDKSVTLVNDGCPGAERVAAAAEVGIEVVNMFVPDMTADIEHMEKVAEVAEDRLLRRGGAVMIHCQAGACRAPAVAAAVCIKLFGKSVDDFPRFMHRVKPHQKEVVRAFEKRVRESENE